jgi:hypothetical protein
MKDGKLLDLTGLSLKLEATKGYSIEDVLKFIAFSRGQNTLVNSKLNQRPADESQVFS